MNLYCSTFITGFSEVISNELKKLLPDITITLLSDGIVFYETGEKIGKIKSFFFLNNSFIVLNFSPHLSHEPLDLMLKQVIADEGIVKSIPRDLIKEKIKFRVMATNENQFVSLHPLLKAKLEKKLLKINSFILDRSYPDVEFTLAVRKEGFGFFGLRFTRHRSYEKTLEKGQLYPELAYLLCLMAQPKSNQILLDPFAGSGSIPLAASNFPLKYIFACDNNKEAIDQLRRTVNKTKKNITLYQADATHLTQFSDHSIDKIVTDPPWGIHDSQQNIEELYKKFLNEFLRILKTNGLLVLLIANNEKFNQLVSKYAKSFRLLKKYTTLVSGQKACVYLFEKS